MLAGGETSATIGAAAAGTNGINTAMVYGTDGGIAAANLQILEDDRHDQPVYAPGADDSRGGAARPTRRSPPSSSR